MRTPPASLWIAATAPLVLLAPLGAAPDESPEFEHEDGYLARVASYRATSEIDYEEGDEKHEVRLSLYVQPPERGDVVCLMEQLTVESTEDDEGDDIYLPSRRGRSVSDSDRTYIAFTDGRAEVMLKEAELSRPAYTVQKMVVATEAVIAQERGEYEMRAIVGDDDLETPYDTSVRLSEMKIGRNHVAEITIEFERETTPGSPLPEAVYALDEDGNVLGGGRWTEGVNIFSDTGEFEAEFLVTDDADVTTLRLVFLTEYEVVPLTFEVTDVFQE